MLILEDGQSLNYTVEGSTVMGWRIGQSVTLLGCTLVMKQELGWECIQYFYLNDDYKLMIQVQQREEIKGHERKVYNKQKINRISLLKSKYLSPSNNTANQSPSILTIKQQAQQKYNQIKPFNPSAQSLQIVPDKIQAYQSNVVRRIILKKLAQQASQCKQNQSQVQIESEQPVESVQYQVRPITIAFDQEYYEQEQSKPQIIVVQKRTVEQLIHLWIHSPSTVVADILNMNPQYRGLKLTSSNPSFSHTIAKLIQQFVFNSKFQKTELQKKSLYSIAIQYFYRNVNELSSEFLLILIKLGSSYLQKYSTFFKNNILRYCQQILINKSLFGAQELSATVNLFITHKQPSHSQLMHLIMLGPSQKLVQLIGRQQFVVEEVLQLASLIRLMKGDWSKLIELYLKLVGFIVDNIGQYQKSIVETVLHYVNQLQLDQRYYQSHKQLKLKLINTLSLFSQDSNKQQNKDGGLLSIWSKTVNKFKSTPKTESPNKPSQTVSGLLFQRYFAGASN